MSLRQTHHFDGHVVACRELREAATYVGLRPRAVLCGADRSARSRQFEVWTCDLAASGVWAWRSVQSA
jgi:hypothetical protein